jgi:hypothetical protein
MWPGQELTVDCACELSYPTTTGSPQRAVVPGFARVEGDYTFYRPRLTMLVVDFYLEATADEEGTVQSWRLELEEV